MNFYVALSHKRRNMYIYLVYILVGNFHGEENGNPLQCSCLENPVDRRAWWAAVHRVAESQT